MEFAQLIEKLELFKHIDLPGVVAHQKLAPLDRHHLKAHQIPPNAKKAGVLVLLFEDDNAQATITLTLRASYKGTHSNQISFPGGRKEESDADLEKTALRETFEEVGINSTEVNVIKQLTSLYIPPSNFYVSPYLGVLKNKPSFKINYEVKKMVLLPVSELLNDHIISSFEIPFTGKNNKNVPCFKYEGHHIWGATAMILSEFKEVVKKL